ncbi:MAG: SDR family NAD(P)-dependent oxidoreductase [Nesterenkonia sp.]|uniref:SDR family NAD(P)-dependent oxidoreductase n=1 Tax=Nesterenkonia marinintestina TaxID=2979865 RepID=UPI0021C1F4D9|nr:SDR family NAD(P)-dependent oxidoreductase [Nesterenkonia sp. GX14115]MDO5493913.1 SDR family NAD(P)-dependent oxidoreductase [Nesterenkonia sp.]
MDIAQRSFLITGGSSGLGAATARKLLSRGAHVVVADLRGPAPEGAELVETDVTDPDQVGAAVARAQQLAPLSGVISCAGVATPNKVLGRSGPHDVDAFRTVVDINLIGAFNVIRLAAEAMAENPAGEDGERGVIVNTASVAAFDGQIGQAAYSASKGAVASMTLPIARELARHGIRVVTVAPGIFRTPMMAGLPQEAQDSLGAQVPFPSRLGEPEEYADLVDHIIANRMLNGETIRLDGAIRMAPK